MPDVKFNKSIIPDLSGRNVLITGGTGGIGAEITFELAKHNPEQIIFTGRNATLADTVIQRVKSAAPNANVSFVQCDLSSLKSVSQAANKVLADLDHLDLFLANAGVMAIPAGLSADGFENHFAINHLGHALLTRKLIPLLEKTADNGADVRVIYTTSLGWKNGSLDFNALNTTMESAILGRWVRYSNSKLANMLYARQVTRRHPKILSYSVHPGVINTALVSDLKLTDRLFVKASMYGQMIPLEQGTYNHLWAVSVPRDSVKAGGFYEPAGVYSSEDLAETKDEKFGDELWEYTERSIAQWL